MKFICCIRHHWNVHFWYESPCQMTITYASSYFFFQIEFFSSLSLSLCGYFLHTYMQLLNTIMTPYTKKIKIWTKNNYFHSFFLLQIKFKAFWAIKRTKITSNCFRRMAFHCWLELVMLSTIWVWLIWQKMLIG